MKTQFEPLENPFLHARQHFEAEIDWLSGADALTMTHSDLEQRLQRSSLEQYRLLLQAHLVLRTQIDRLSAPQTILGADKITRTHKRPTGRTLATLFGVVTVKRQGYSAPGSPRLHPLDAALNLPPERYSFGLQRLVAETVATDPYERVVKSLASSTGTAIPKRQIEQLVLRAAVDFDDFYAQREVMAEQAGGEILVLSFDGKGVPMRRVDLRPATRKVGQPRRYRVVQRFSRRTQRGYKRMAQVATVYTIDPFVRTAADLVRELWPDEDAAAPLRRPRPQQKRVWASLQHPPAQVIAQAFDEAQRRDPLHLKRWVVLIDGQEHQLKLIQKEIARRHLQVTLVLDVIHVLGYVWSAARVFHPDHQAEAQRWVSLQLWQILTGGCRVVAANLRSLAKRGGLEQAQRAPVDKCADYLRKYAAYLGYPPVLATGMPIATGVIEGACRHLIKDRLELTGARWRLLGAEAVLRLRSLLSSGDFEEYWQFHLQQEFRRNHALHFPPSSPLKLVPAPDLPADLQAVA